MSDFGNGTSPVARKDYRCEWCGQKIPKGEKHFQYTGVWQDEWQYWRMHKECEKQRQIDYDGDGEFSSFGNDRGGSPNYGPLTPEKVVTL